jgi:hypothetical protein
MHVNTWRAAYALFNICLIYMKILNDSKGAERKNDRKKEVTKRGKKE